MILVGFKWNYLFPNDISCFENICVEMMLVVSQWNLEIEIIFVFK